MSKIKVLQAHNYYLQPGGEDTVFESEVALLRDHGHSVVTYVESDEGIHSVPPVTLAAQTIYSPKTYRALLDLIAREKPEIAHFHNTFPLISPAAYYACRTAGVPIVQSLHNPRLICPAASFYRDGRNCIECLGKTPPYPGVFHGCYHHSRAQTGVVATMLTVHRLLGTWNHIVDRYVVASRFYLDLFRRAGLPADRIAYKPHFVESALPFEPDRPNGEYALFIGRLDPEKGVNVLLEAWKKTHIPLKIRGSGQMEEEIRQIIAENQPANLELVDRLSRHELGELIRGARFLVWPTEGYYETFGLVAVESYALGVPVIGSRTGVNAEIVQDGETGWHFAPGDADDLAQKMQSAWDHPELAARLGRNARREYETKYTPERNYDMTLSIYDDVMKGRLQNSD